MKELIQNYLPLPPASVWEWLAILIGAAVLIVSVSVSVNVLSKWLIKHTERSSTEWDNALISSLHTPVTVVIWVVGVTYTAEILWLSFDQKVMEGLVTARRLGIIICLFWALLRFLHSAEKIVIVAKRKRDYSFDEAGFRTVFKISRVVAIFAAGLFVFSNLGFSISGVLAFGGIGGIAVGFAAKDLLANFFGGLMIFLDRPFTEGDWIRSPDREIEGIVEKIGWRLTRIQTFERRPIYVPNSVFTQVVVENASRMESRRLKEVVGVRYQDINQVSKIVDEVRAYLEQNPKIDERRLLIVALSAFSASSVDILVYCYVQETQSKLFYAEKQAILLKISEIITANNAEIAFPTRTLHVFQEE